MTVLPIVLVTLAAAAALLLVRTGIDHLRDPATLARVLAGPRARARWAARGVAGLELVTGTAALATLLLGSLPGSPLFGSAGAGWALAAQGGLYLGFTASLWVRFRRGDRTDCGCTALPAVVGPAALARAAGLALASLLAALVTPGPAAFAAGAAALGLVAAGTAVLAGLLHALPAAIDGVPALPAGRAT